MTMNETTTEPIAQTVLPRVAVHSALVPARDADRFTRATVRGHAEEDPVEIWFNTYEWDLTAEESKALCSHTYAEYAFQLDRPQAQDLHRLLSEHLNTDNQNGA